MILRGARVALNARRARHLDITIYGCIIQSLGVAATSEAIDLSGYLCLPGLINAHDHLEFNLFPRLGKGPHANATAWAKKIYRPNESPVREHRSVPKRTRLIWGGLKNLVSGVTTVCHHNPYEPAVFNSRFPVRVLREFGWAHSLAFAPDTPARLASTPPAWPFIIHAAEATDGSAATELQQLENIGAVDSRLVIVHGVDFTPRQWRSLREHGAACITCLSSNLFTLGRTIPVSAFRSGVPIALATDSALTANGDLLDELRIAQRVWRLPVSRIYEMVTSTPAAILRLTRGEGQLREQGAADVIAIRDRGLSPAESLLKARRIDLVVQRGCVRLVSTRLAVRLPQSLVRNLHPLYLAGRGRMLVDSDTAALARRALEFLPAPLRLAGRRVAV